MAASPPTCGVPAGVLVRPDARTVARAEALGFGTLWVSGHLATGGPASEGVVNLARLAALTQRAAVGVAALVVSLYNPVIVAKQVGELHHDLGGRLLFGMGVGGEHPAEFRMAGVDPAERGPRTDEAIEVCRRLWSGETRSFAGRFYTFENVRLDPVSPGGPPIIVTGRKPPAQRRAGLLGDGWLPYLVSPRAYAESVDRIRATAAQAGRSLDAFRWMATLFLVIDDDRDRARRDLAAFLGGAYRKDFDPLLDSVGVAGAPAEVVERVQAFLDAGARELMFILPPGRWDEQAEALASLILPNLRIGAAERRAPQ